MINNIVYNSAERSIKIINPTSPSAKRKSIDVSDGNHIQSISNTVK